tara:strand:- start:958 stop:1380 length:423 start_codon:yes stop_codon:yes gene_type:complete
MKKGKIIAIAVLCAAIGGFSYGVKEFNRKSIAAFEGATEITSTSTDLINAFQKNNSDNSVKYIGKVTEVSGILTSVLNEGKVLVLDKTIRCELDATFKSEFLSEGGSFKIGESLKVKGYFGGYDDLMEEVLFVRCGLKLD